MAQHHFDPLHIAKLAKLELQADSTQAAQLTKEIGHILDAINQLQSIDTQQVEPLANPLESTQPLRADAVTETDQRQQFQQLAPESRDGLYLVPQVIEQASDDK